MAGFATTSVAVAGGTVVAVEHEHPGTDGAVEGQRGAGVQHTAQEDDTQMEVDSPSLPLA